MFKFLKKFSRSAKDTAKKFFHLIIPHAIDRESIKNIENVLYDADFGTEVTPEIIDEIKSALKHDRELRRENIIHIVSMVLKRNLEGSEASLNIGEQRPQVICLVGANGVGKTTTAAKLAHFYKTAGKEVMLGSCDTFRAAANEQLNSWGSKLSVEVISSQHGADPAAVAFDAYKAALARGKDILILDTAGRLHVKSNLMAELQKIFRVLKKSNSNLVPNVWLVIDSAIGSNTIESAKAFHAEIGLTGLIMTKLDGTSVGGTLVGAYKKLHIPIYFIGTGETPDSLEQFSIENYIHRLFPSDNLRNSHG
ncbi:MAG: signal recognition particle-docking protein FtsY [Puniceicoccales bacterium]|jgi:fused signal recognition particle receptor|nr:signal recognition particle-docking protein FtsY [Puniceicoccales bacterium]